MSVRTQVTRRKQVVTLTQDNLLVTFRDLNLSFFSNEKLWFANMKRTKNYPKVEYPGTRMLTVSQTLKAWGYQMLFPNQIFQMAGPNFF